MTFEHKFPPGADADLSAIPVAPPEENWVRLERMVPPLVHELRNSLAALHMALDLADTRLGASGQAGASLKDAGAPVVAHANNVLSGLLQLVDPKPVQLAAFDLSKLAAQVAQAAEFGPGTPPFVAPPNMARVQLVLAPNAWAHGSRNATALALRELLMNAHEALPPNAGTLVVELLACEAGWDLHVVDNGPGVAPQVQDKLFSPFVTTKRRHLGLGLTYAWRGMRAQGGELRQSQAAQKRFGHGASFVLSLPRAAAGRGAPAAGK